MIDKKFINLHPLFNMLVYNSTNEFDILRELIKRAYEANASKIEIRFFYSSAYGLCIEVLDNGKEMTLEELKDFFSIRNISNSQNTKDKINSAILLNCDYLEIRTGNKSTPSYKATLSDYFKKYNAIFNNDDLDIFKEDNYTEGSKIILYGYNLENKHSYYTKLYHDDEEFVKKIYNYKRVEDYLLWNTHVGNMKKIFYHLYGGNNDYYKFSGCQPHIDIIDEINNKTVHIDTASIGLDEAYSGFNSLTECENTIYPRTSNMCYKFKKYFEQTNINGKLVSFYLYGYVAGEKYRLSKCNLNNNEKLSDRFGLYLAKDFINFKKENFILNVPDIEHFKIVINSEIFNLSLDKRDLTNRNTQEVKWVLDEAKKIIDKEIIPTAYNNYFRIRKEEEFEENYKRQLFNT